MPGKFNKKNAVTYRLVHRSQKDPLLADASESQYVLMPIKGQGRNLFAESEEDSNEHDSEEYQENEQENEEENVGEQMIFDPKTDPSNFGVYFKDDDTYDYMQHLKPIGEDPSAVLIDNRPKQPKQGIQFVDNESESKQGIDSVFGSKTEMEVGLMNQEALPEFDLHMDPEVKDAFTALEDEAYVEDLDDGFFDAFHAEKVPENIRVLQTIQEDQELEFDEDDEPWVNEYKKYQKQKKCDNSDDEFSDEDGSVFEKAATSQFSMSSSAMFRNSKLTLLDDQFDKILQDYSDEEIGELDPDDIDLKGKYDVLDPNFENEHVNQLFDDFLENLHIIGQKHRVVTRDPTENLDAIRRELKEDAKKVVEKYGVIEDKPDDGPIRMPEPKKRNQWDAESVLSLHSNIYNRPQLIKELSKNAPKIQLRKGMPTVISNESDSSEESEEEKGTLFYNTVNKGKARDQKETKEEKRARKELVKQEKRNRRESKKATKVAFQTEKGRQTKLEPNHKLLKNSVPL